MISRALVLLGTFALAAPALASQEFPPHIDDTLTLGYEPVCTICHATLTGGFGTVVQPFGQAMQSRGLVAGDLTALENALAALEAEGSDVDGDGVGDIQELRNGSDPNSASGGDDPEYGCIGNVAPVSSSWPGAALVLAALGLIALRRKTA